MKKTVAVAASSILAALMLSGCSGSAASGGGKKAEEAIYLGVEGYGEEDRNIDNKNKFRFRFFVGGREEVYTIDNGEREEDGVYAYPIQNILQEGYLYDLVVKDDVVVSVTPLDHQSEWVISGELTSKDAKTGTVVIGERPVTLTNETVVFRVDMLPGGAEVTAARPQIGDKVRAVINSNGKAAGLYIMPVADAYVPPVNGTPGEKTILNYLKTALAPVGTCLYVYGGGWNWQNTKAGTQAVSIGLPVTWTEFFQMQDSDYVFRKKNTEDPDDPQHSYFPYMHYNEYYYAGADCSGYLGWVLYNVLNEESGGNGYVMTSTETALTYSNNGWGTYTRDLKKPADHDTSAFLPGDIVSISGHVWICLGTCRDGSIVILHSSPTDSRTGGHGGGVQMSALGDSEDCEAYKLVCDYMSTWYPDWYERYQPVLKPFATYADMMSDINAGKFSFDVSGAGILSDPDGVRSMTPDEILAMVYGTDEA